MCVLVRLLVVEWHTYGGRKPLILHYLNSLVGTNFDDNLRNGLASTNPEIQKKLGFLQLNYMKIFIKLFCLLYFEIMTVIRWQQV